MNETNSIGGVKTYTLQSIDAILVYIVMNGPMVGWKILSKNLAESVSFLTDKNCPHDTSVD